jgi:hypothetical protein
VTGVTDAHPPADDRPSDRSATSSGPTTREPSSEREGPAATVGVDVPDAVDLEPVDLDAIEADLDRVESALQQIADGTYWEQNGASVDPPTANEATSTATSISGPPASA